MKPKYFATPLEFRRWLDKNHHTASELWVGLYKKATGKPSITWPEVVDEVLCFGWIDGIRKSIDETSYMNRVTPRRPGSNWSAVNIQKVQTLTAEGRMRPAGKAAFETRDASKAERYSYEQRTTVTLTPAMERRFRKNAKAWLFFKALPAGYRQLSIFRVMDAVREATRERRLEQLIEMCAAGRRIEPMAPAAKNKTGRKP